MVNFLVIGSAHLDIIAESIRHKDTIDRPGSLNIEFGGTAANVATSLSNGSDDVSVKFLTAMNESAISKAIIGEINKCGVGVVCQVDNELPESGFSAHLSDGDMYSAIASVAVEQHRFIVNDELLMLCDAADWVVIDCNIKTESIAVFLDLAKDKGKKTALFLVSESKGLKIAEVPHVDYVFCNQREYLYLQMNQPSWQANGRTIFFVTNGENGSIALNDGRRINHTQALPSAKIVNFMGAGDAYAAGVLESLSKGGDISDAMLQGSVFANKILSQSHCHTGKGNSLNKQLEYLANKAYHDKLTGLYNRQALDDILFSLADENHLSVMLLDIDHFKNINDTHGHKVGDQVLVHLSTLLNRCINKNDYGIRFGGEEFILLTPVSLDIAETMANRIRSHIEEHGAIGPIQSLTVSIGVSYISTINGFEKALEIADELLYKAKESGRNLVCAG